MVRVHLRHQRNSRKSATKKQQAKEYYLEQRRFKRRVIDGIHLSINTYFVRYAVVEILAERPWSVFQLPGRAAIQHHR
jgi:hypothetical protein